MIRCDENKNDLKPITTVRGKGRLPKTAGGDDASFTSSYKVSANVMNIVWFSTESAQTIKKNNFVQNHSLTMEMTSTQTNSILVTMATTNTMTTAAATTVTNLSPWITTASVTRPPADIVAGESATTTTTQYRDQGK